MVQTDLPSLERFAAALRQPATLIERGVYVPFSSPFLFGARVRRASSGHLEVIVAHQSGQRAWLVMPWPAVLEACQPTLADRALWHSLGGRSPDPGVMRERVAAVARSGLLGRRARASASTAPAMPPGLGNFAASLLAWQDHAPTKEDKGRALALAGQAAALARAAAHVTDLSCRSWLQDGWALMGAIWEAAAEKDQVAILKRLCALLPAWPEELRHWPGCEELFAQPLPAHPGAQLRFATQHLCEAAIARWLAQQCQ